MQHRQYEYNSIEIIKLYHRNYNFVHVVMLYVVITPLSI